MGRKTTNFNKSGISKLPDNKPVLYRIQTLSRDTNYAGIAKNRRARLRV